MPVHVITLAAPERLYTIQVLPFDELTSYPFTLLRTTEGSTIKVSLDGIALGRFNDFNDVRPQWPMKDACFSADEHGLYLDFGHRWRGTRQLLVNLETAEHRDQAAMFIRESHKVMAGGARAAYEGAVHD